MDSINMEKMDYFWQLYEIYYFRFKNMDSLSSNCYPLFARWESSRRKNKKRTNEAELHWKK